MSWRLSKKESYLRASLDGRDLAAATTAGPRAFLHKGPGAAFAFELVRIGVRMLYIYIYMCVFLYIRGALFDTLPFMGLLIDERGW